MQVFLETDPGLAVDTAANGSDALEALSERSYSVVVTDLKMPRVDGLQLLEEVQKRRLPADVIITTGFGTIDHAVQAMRLGPPISSPSRSSLSTFGWSCNGHCASGHLQDEVVALREKLHAQFKFHDILSKSPRMHDVFELISHVAQTISTVLIVGETGTGKELVARAVHEASPRRTGPVRRRQLRRAARSRCWKASSSATRRERSPARSASARAGSSWRTAARSFWTKSARSRLAMQAKLLRVLQERRFERVGRLRRRSRSTSGSSPPPTATCSARQGGQVPRRPLLSSERRQDRPAAAARASRRHRPSWRSTSSRSSAGRERRPSKSLRRRWKPSCSIAGRATFASSKMPWNGHASPRATTWSGRKTCPSEILKPSRPRYQLPVDLSRPLTEQLTELTAAFEERYLRRALKRTRGHIGRTAHLTGLSRRTITEKLALYQIEKAEFKTD